MFLKNVQKPYTYTDYFKWHEHELTSPCFLSFRCTYKGRYQVRLSRYGQNVWNINGKEIQYLMVKENLTVP